VGPGASIAVADYNHGTPGLCGGGALCNEFIRLPIQMVERMPVNTPRWGLGHKQAMRTFYKRNIAVMGPTQPIPMADGRITLDPAVTDKWGMPVARISGNVHPHTFEIGLRQAQRAEAWLKEAGAMSTIVNAGKPTIVSGGQHQAGTCRMGNDPQGSVVNRDCQVHDADMGASIPRSPSWRLLTWPRRRWSATGRVRDSNHEADLQVCGDCGRRGGIAWHRRNVWRVVLLLVGARAGVRELPRDGLVHERCSRLGAPRPYVR
jgi:hypothetical protein